jgi:hypothetical protein
MSEELGRVTKPEVSSFKHNRKILQVPLIYSGKDAPADYVVLFEKYWQQATEMISRLEGKLGNATVILHESVTDTGEYGNKIIKELNPKSHALCEARIKSGGSLLSFEDPVLLAEVMDWERCLMIGFISENVARKVYDSFHEASKLRYQHISKAIDELLKDGDIALLFIREGHSVQFPVDMDVFMVAPPALDEIHRWARDRKNKMDQEQAGS